MRDRRDHGVAVGRELGLLGDDRDVDVRDLRGHLVEDALGLAHEDRGVGAAPALVGGGKVLADVARAGGAEDRVGDRVEHGVGVGVTGESAGVRDAHAAEDERTAGVERMDVDALAYSNYRPDHVALHCCRYDSAMARSSGTVIFRLRGSPGTARTV